MNVKTLERCFNERVDREMNNIVDTVEDRIQNAILTAIDNIVAPKIELAIRSISASSGRDVTSVSVNSERREHVGIKASFENASGNNDTQVKVISKVNDETRHSITEEVSELSVPETHFDRQPHTHHMVKGNGDRQSQTHHINRKRTRGNRRGFINQVDLSLIAAVTQLARLLDVLRILSQNVKVHRSNGMLQNQDVQFVDGVRSSSGSFH